MKEKNQYSNFWNFVAIYEEYYQIDSFKEFVRETKEFLNQRKPNYVVLENFEIVDLSYEIKREVEELYAKHLSGNLSSEFNNDFDDTSIEWGEIDREDIGWNDFRSENLYFELQNWGNYQLCLIIRLIHQIKPKKRKNDLDYYLKLRNDTRINRKIKMTEAGLLQKKGRSRYGITQELIISINRCKSDWR